MALSMDWNEREAKVIQRDKLFEGLSSLTPCKSYLTLPGAQCVDVKEALKRGVITHESRITAVEREIDDYLQAEKWFHKNWPQAVPGLIHSDLHKITDLNKFDLMFLDYLGNLTFDGAKWIREHLAHHIMKGARLGLTISSCPRGSVFVPALQSFVRRWFPDLCTISSEQLIQSGFPQDVLNYAIPYVIFITCYLFPCHDYRWSLHYGGEQQSTHRMLLFRLMDMQPVLQTERLSDLELKAQKSLIKFVERGYKKEVSNREEVEMPTTVTGEQVITAIMQADSPGLKAAATKMLNRYADMREQQGKKRIMVIAGIRARIKRIENGNA